MQLVRSRTTHILAVENITARQNGSRISSNQVKQLTAQMVDAMPLAADVALAVKTNVAVSQGVISVGRLTEALLCSYGELAELASLYGQTLHGH